LTIKICVSVLPQTVTEALNLIEKAQNERADFIEVRLDKLKNCKLSDITAYSDTPLIATDRSIRCQGKSPVAEQRILINAAKNGFEFVDVELFTPRVKEIVGNLRDLGTKQIISFHDFNTTPKSSQLGRILEKEITNGADLCKIVTTARFAEDNLTVLDFVSNACKNAKIVCFSMGKLGRLSRLLSPLFGAFFTIASIEDARETADGQLTIQQMRSAWKALELN
jgi:3-dehydroquinate dehydratase type I